MDTGGKTNDKERRGKSLLRENRARGSKGVGIDFYRRGVEIDAGNRASPPLPLFSSVQHSLDLAGGDFRVALTSGVGV